MSDLVATHEEIRQKYAEFAPVYRRKTWVIEHIFGVKRLRKKLLNRAEGQILEVACGTGENFRYVQRATGITAVDLSPDMLALAQESAKKLKMSVDFQTMAAEQLEFEDDSFDTVISTLSTCTFHDPVAALREMKRVCRPDGRILLIEHGRSRWKWLAGYQDRHAHTHFEGTGCRWNQDPLEIIIASGLKIVNSRRHFLGIFHTIEAQPS